MTITNRIDIGDFMIRAHRKVQAEDYRAAAAVDPQGIEVIECALGKELLAFGSWGEIFDEVDTLLKDGMLLRLQIVYAQYMLAKIERALGGKPSQQDEVTTGYRYYLEQIPYRCKLLAQWVSHNPEDQHLLANLNASNTSEIVGRSLQR